VDGKRKECVVIGWLDGGIYESVGRRDEQTGGLLRERANECVEGRTDV
jgi:hypothetical protein